MICLTIGAILLGLMGNNAALAAPKQSRPGGTATVQLTDIDSGLTSPSGVYRWLDVADQAYSDSYRTSYNYTQATVTVKYTQSGNLLQGTLTASNLKPNFAYQLKLVGDPEADPAANERIGLAGRWWQEVWNGSAWADGANLNNKGDGSSPNPNDDVYYANRYIADPLGSSPTGMKYRYTGYLVFDYFITNRSGKARLNFIVNSSYHVLFKTSQGPRNPDDGPTKTVTFDADPSSVAYTTDYPPQTVGIYGEWERLPVGGIYPDIGSYNCRIILTEESFHGNGTYAGNWAAAMGAALSFIIN